MEIDAEEIIVTDGLRAIGIEYFSDEMAYIYLGMWLMQKRAANEQRHNNPLSGRGRGWKPNHLATNDRGKKNNWIFIPPIKEQ